MAYSEIEARKLVIKAGLELVNKKLIARTWGNISARVSDNEFVITPSGKPYETLKESDLVKVRIDDLSYPEGVKPSSEKGIHAAAYKLRSNINFVIHTHQNYATAISLDKKQNVAGNAKYGLPGTKTLVKNVYKILDNYKEDNAFLMERHGTICLGATYEDAFLEASKLEEKAKTYYDANHKEVSAKKKALPYVDDYAQMFGYSAKPAETDKTAIELIKYKNELAANMASSSMNFFDVVIQNVVYKLKYSKLKDKK